MDGGGGRRLRPPRRLILVRAGENPMTRIRSALVFRLIPPILPVLAGCASSGSIPAPVEPESAAAAAPAADPYPAGEWVSLFDGATLAGWRILRDYDFTGAGEVAVADGAIVLGAGQSLTGIARAGVVPRDNYEVSLEAQRLEGRDFFCGLTFPVGEEHSTLIVGGWGGGVVGLSNVDGLDATENDTTTGFDVENGRWYAIRLRVTAAKIEMWIDGERIIDLDRPQKRFDVWIQQQPARPLGIATYETRAALRDVRVRRL
jgi:hypothetical protein